MNRKTSILVSSVAASALAFGIAGAATAAISSDSPATAKSAAVPPAPDAAAVRGEVSGLDAASKAVAPLKAALAERPDAVRVRQLVNQAKRAMDQLAHGTMAPQSAVRPSAPKPNDFIAQAVPRVKQRLDAVARAAAAPNPDPGDLLNSIQGVVKGLIDLLSGLLTSVHNPANSVPIQQPAIPISGR